MVTQVQDSHSQPRPTLSYPRTRTKEMFKICNLSPIEAAHSYFQLKLYRIGESLKDELDMWLRLLDMLRHVVRFDMSYGPAIKFTYVKFQ